MINYSGLLSLFVLLFILIGCNSNEKSSFKPHFGETEDNYYAADNIAGHIHLPNVEREFGWEEHPTGKIIQKTNNLGFREDNDTKVKKETNTIRILATGDSHTDGVILNNESFPNVLENLLNNCSSTTYECINAGAGYYGPQNYLGILRKFIHLQPDIFIVNVYTGNDFLDAIRIEVENERLSVPKREESYYHDLWEVDEKHPGFTGQLMNQIKYFKFYPNIVENAISITTQNFTQINELCQQHSIKLYVLLLPTKVDIEPQTDSIRIADVKNILKFSDEDLGINNKLTQMLKDKLHSQNIQFIDLSEHWKSGEMEELFWKADYHVNHIGHKSIAEILAKNLN